MSVVALLVAGGLTAALVATGCDRQEEPPPDAVSRSTPETQPYTYAAFSTTQTQAADTRSHAAPAGATTAAATSPASPPVKPPAAQVEPFLPLLDAVEGEWARYSAMHGRAIRYEIADVSPARVKTQVTVYDHGKPIGLPAIREDARDLDPVARRARAAGAQRRQIKTTTEAAGRRWDASLYEDQWTDEEIHYVRRTWVSLETPVFGIIRMELHGDGVLEARLKLTAMGRED